MFLRRFLCFWITVSFVSTLIIPPQRLYAQTVLDLPAAGTMVSVSPSFEPALIKGLTVHKDNPFLFDFIVDPGQGSSGVIARPSSGVKRPNVLDGDPFGQADAAKQSLKEQADRMIKYFFAALTIPDKDIWVNLSPYEKDRMVPVSLGQTAMGRDLLAQDYLLKQLTASLIYPQKALGKTFWAKVYAKAKEMYGTTQIPVNTFNKVWIVPQKAGVYEHNQTAFIVNGHLKVMLEEDYLALSKHQRQPGDMFKSELQRTCPQAGCQASEPLNVKAPQGNPPNALASQIIRQIILPEIEKEINEGKNFATLRQIFYAQVLAVWFKRNLKQALLNQVYANKGTVKGIERPFSTVIPAKAGIQPMDDNEAIYRQYLRAYKKGVFNFIQEEPAEGTTIPRKYFSGGYSGVADMALVSEPLSEKAKAEISHDVDFAVLAAGSKDLANPDAAMTDEEEIVRRINFLYIVAAKDYFGGFMPVTSLILFAKGDIPQIPAGDQEILKRHDLLNSDGSLPNTVKTVAARFNAAKVSEKVWEAIHLLASTDKNILGYTKALENLGNPEFYKNDGGSYRMNDLNAAGSALHPLYYPNVYREGLENAIKRLREAGIIIERRPYGEEGTHYFARIISEEVRMMADRIRVELSKIGKGSQSQLITILETLPSLSITDHHPYIMYVKVGFQNEGVHSQIASALIEAIKGYRNDLESSAYYEFVETHIVHGRRTLGITVETKKLGTLERYEGESILQNTLEIFEKAKKLIIEQSAREAAADAAMAAQVVLPEQINDNTFKSGETWMITYKNIYDPDRKERTEKATVIQFQQGTLYVHMYQGNQWGIDVPGYPVGMKTLHPLIFVRAVKVGDAAMRSERQIAEEQIRYHIQQLSNTEGALERAKSDLRDANKREIRLRGSKAQSRARTEAEDVQRIVNRLESDKGREERMLRQVQARLPRLRRLPKDAAMMGQLITTLRKSMVIEVQGKGSKVTFNATPQVKAVAEDLLTTINPKVQLSEGPLSADEIASIQAWLSKISGSQVTVASEGRSFSFETNLSVPEINKRFDTAMVVEGVAYTIGSVLMASAAYLELQKILPRPSVLLFTAFTALSIVLGFKAYHSFTSSNPHLLPNTEQVLLNNGVNPKLILPQPVAFKDKAQSNLGGIDLSQQDAALHVEKDANGGVKVNVDPALIARIEREGMPEVVPVIINMRPADIRSLFGVGA